MKKLLLRLKLILVWIQRPLFIIKLSDGQASKIMGQVKNSFVLDCSDIANQNGVKSGLIYGKPGQFGKMTIMVSGNISKEMLQQLRNSWGIIYDHG